MCAGEASLGKKTQGYRRKRTAAAGSWKATDKPDTVQGRRAKNTAREEERREGGRSTVTRERTDRRRVGQV